MAVTSGVQLSNVLLKAQERHHGHQIIIVDRGGRQTLG